ncbi:hypothetical protein [Cesiribacter sp. SM1]|uniref:hypothetical protein n=1 Tax=Cesiribacter sp. SM1 TaxID=2861196 RepID=UPI001CD5E1EA|nr:hypothetical protein [Cesiribacter sp. SM1]
MLLRYAKIAPLTMVLMLLGLSSCLYTVEETASFDLQNNGDTVQGPDSGMPAPDSDPFVALVGQLNHIGYYQQKQDCSYPIENGFYCLIPPVENAISKRIEAVNSDLDSGSSSLAPEQEITVVNMEGLLEIKSCFLLADYEVAANTYPRATVEEWTFDEELSAEKVAEQLSSLTEEEWYYLSESKISWWRKNHKLYFIFPAGNLMLSEIAKLQEKMQEIM